MGYTFDAHGRPLSGTPTPPEAPSGPQADAGYRQAIPAGETVVLEQAEAATTIELFVESGRVRVRTDDVSPSATTGEPMGPGTWRSWRVPVLRVHAVDAQAVVTSISR